MSKLGIIENSCYSVALVILQNSSLNNKVIRKYKVEIKYNFIINKFFISFKFVQFIKHNVIVTDIDNFYIYLQYHCTTFYITKRSKCSLLEFF